MKIYLVGHENYKYNLSEVSVPNHGYKWISSLGITIKNKYGLVDNPEEADVILQLESIDFDIANICHCTDTTLKIDPVTNEVSNFCCDKKKRNELYKIEAIMNRYGKTKKYFFYVWDFYTWSSDYVFSGRQQKGGHMDMMRLISVLQKCECVFVPNEGTKQSLKAMTRTDNIKVILPSARLYDTPEEHILDKDYVAIAARKYTIDSTEKWLHWALSELNIPHISVQKPSHAEYLADPKNYTDFLNHCSFVASAKLEASTGGMSLVEAYNNGKPVLIPNSSLHGANDIFGDRAYKYDYGSYDSLKSSLQYLWEKRPKQNLKECREFCKNFTVDAMSERIYEAMK